MSQSKDGTNLFILFLSVVLVGIPVSLVLFADERRLDLPIPEKWRDGVVYGLTLAWFWGSLKIVRKVRQVLEARDALVKESIQGISKQTNCSS
jgi:hypothetical protein